MVAVVSAIAHGIPVDAYSACIGVVERKVEA